MINLFKLLKIIFLFVLLSTVSHLANAGGGDRQFTDKEILGSLFRNLDIKLNEAAYCSRAGTELSDQTIGDYLSGFWAFHMDKNGQNWLDISSSKIKDDKYLARVMIYRKQGEENWGWGVSFELDKSLQVNRGSFTCLGGG